MTTLTFDCKSPALCNCNALDSAGLVTVKQKNFNMLGLQGFAFQSLAPKTAKIKPKASNATSRQTQQSEISKQSKNEKCIKMNCQTKAWTKPNRKLWDTKEKFTAEQGRLTSAPHSLGGFGLSDKKCLWGKLSETVRRLHDPRNRLWNVQTSF